MMQSMWTMLAVFLLVVTGGSAFGESDNQMSVFGESECTNQEPLPKISLVKQIANPEEFNERCVRTVGVFFAAHESSAMFLDSDSYKLKIFANSIRMDIQNSAIDSASELNGEYVHVIARFVATPDLRYHTGVLKSVSVVWK